MSRAFGLREDAMQRPDGIKGIELLLVNPLREVRQREPGFRDGLFYAGLLELDETAEPTRVEVAFVARRAGNTSPCPNRR